MKKFMTKGIYMTKSIKSDIHGGKLSLAKVNDCLKRHFNNDGDECREDKKYNRLAIEGKEGRVFSVFNLDNKKIFIITEGLHLAEDPEYGLTYPMTTILYPEEY